MASYLLIIGDREALGWILMESRTAFPGAGRPWVAALEEGDTFFLYTTRGCFKNPTRDRGRIIGTAEVVSPLRRLDPPPSFGDREFPIGCALKLGELAPFGAGVELRPLVASLDAFGQSAHAWSARLRQPMLRLSDADAARLHGLLTDVEPAESADAYTTWWRGVAQA